MVRINNTKKHEVTSEGLKVYLEGPSPIALTSPEAQRLVFNYAKESGFKDYGMNKFVPLTKDLKDNVFTSSGYWLMLPTQWNSRSVKV